MRSIFVGIIVVSASMTALHSAQAQAQSQRPFDHVQTPMGYQRPTDDDLKAIERDNERNQLPATQDNITGAAPVQSEENALTGRIDRDNARLDRLIRGICPTC